MNHQILAEPHFQALLTDLKTQFLQEKTPKTIWVACSGGLDSCALLFLMDALQRSELSFEIGVLHVNFALRGEESDRDEAFIRQQAAAYGREIRVLKVDPAEHPQAKTGIQEWARNLRYAWFAELKGPQDWIAVAHQKDDFIETIFARLCRGHSLLALSGMQVMHQGMWRPLLNRSREDLQRLVTLHQLSYCEDSSNSGLDYTRNKLRHKVLPELEQLFPGVGQNLWMHAQDLQDALNFLQKQIPPLILGDELDFDSLRTRPPFLARQEIANFLQKQDAGFKPRRDLLLEIYEALGSGRSWEQSLSPGIKVRCQQGVLSVSSRKTPESPRWRQYRTALLDETPEQWPEAVPDSKKKKEPH